jgi:hypothetical protein
VTSLPGFGRRCHLVRATAALASSLDFLQDTFEKIHLHRLLRQHPLQLPGLLTVGRFVRGRLGRFLSWLHHCYPGSASRNNSQLKPFPLHLKANRLRRLLLPMARQLTARETAAKGRTSEMDSLRLTEKNKAGPENRILREGDSSRGRLHYDFASPQVAEKLELRLAQGFTLILSAKPDSIKGGQ